MGVTTSVNAEGTEESARHVIRELGFQLSRVGDELHGRATVIPELCVPGTTTVRTSVFAAWTDTIAGLLASRAIAPRVPTTLELDVHLARQPSACRVVDAVGQMVKAGSSVNVLSVEFTSDAGDPLGHGSASFMATPDRTVTVPHDAIRQASALPAERLRVPLAERAGCERREPGVAVLPKSDDGLNVAKTINGGLIALVVEEAALSLTADATLSSMALRYLRPMRIGPAIATAHVHAGLGRVEVRDAGSADRLSVIATTRTFPPEIS